MLPIGSIVYLKKGTKKIMILNRGPIIVQEEEKRMFDYSGCLYPIGLVIDTIIYFNHENINELVFEGYKDRDEQHFQKLFCDWEKSNQIKKGNVNKPFNNH